MSSLLVVDPRPADQPRDHHTAWCTCHECTPYHPADGHPFTWRDAGLWALAGGAPTLLLLFAWDPAGTLRAFGL